MDNPSVAIILVNWKSPQYTIDCIASVKKLCYTNYDLIVVENGSDDNSSALIRQAYPEIKLMEMSENLGFVGGNNVAIREAQARGAEYVLLLNNDTVVDSDFLDKLIEAIQADPAIGIAGPTIFYFDHPETIWSAGGEILWNAGLTRMSNIGETDHGQLGCAPREVDFVTGCALLIKMEAIEKIGLLDPRFFAYYEEAEWCVRASRVGYKIIHVPTAKIWHKISLQEREASPMVHYYMTRNRLLFLKLIKVGPGAWIYTLFFDLSPTLLSWWIKPKWQHKKLQRKMMVKAIFDFSLGRFGKLVS